MPGERPIPGDDSQTSSLNFPPATSEEPHSPPLPWLITPSTVLADEEDARDTLLYGLGGEESGRSATPTDPEHDAEFLGDEDSVVVVRDTANSANNTKVGQGRLAGTEAQQHPARRFFNRRTSRHPSSAFSEGSADVPVSGNMRWKRHVYAESGWPGYAKGERALPNADLDVLQEGHAATTGDLASFDYNALEGENAEQDSITAADVALQINEKLLADLDMKSMLIAPANSDNRSYPVVIDGKTMPITEIRKHSAGASGETDGDMIEGNYTRSGTANYKQEQVQHDQHRNALYVEDDKDSNYTRSTTTDGESEGQSMNQKRPTTTDFGYDRDHDQTRGRAAPQRRHTELTGLGDSAPSSRELGLLATDSDERESPIVPPPSPRTPRAVKTPLLVDPAYLPDFARHPHPRLA
ncbi:unnamed protein product [Amoebophrya sp. A25]|nr:unnamed protein product [Amoebophrya sp. A25]|eukprot:GSA25T00011241001.1